MKPLQIEEPKDKEFRIERELSLSAQAQIFHIENPQVMDRILSIMTNRKNRGFKRYGMKAVFEELRHDPSFVTKSGDHYKMNNNHTAWYARKFMELYPEFDGFFEVRGQL